MVKRYSGGFISSVEATTSNTSASGFWSSTDQMQKRRALSWPNAFLLNRIEYLVVAGGGSGQNGGGGGGGLIYNSSFFITLGSTYTITVGAGGSGGAQGSNSVFNTVTAIGGGYGSAINYPNPGTGGNGGSGGGGSPPYRTDNGPPGPGGKGVYPGSTYISDTRQGYDGGQSDVAYRSVGAYWLGGSGGGAGGPGEAPTYLAPWAVYDANGGPGLSYFGTYYAGGGAGGDNNTGVTTKGIGGLGGGGNTANSGTVNTGGGGGGDGGNGGSGVVIVRYPDRYNNATSVTGSPTLTISGGYKLYTFTSSGSITF